jgi:alkanesulfonate monooxygenase SsuD/methylene tetrahydromethanopterin reductase-like flavin-dependent oxidoreductase (luciferase family)
MKLPLRDPLIVAKMLSSLAVVSGERIEFGVGLSWIPEEFEWTGTSMRTRGARLDEQIEILRLLCGGGGPKYVEYEGRHYQFGRLMMSPSPEQPVRIHIGGHSAPALDRAARVGEGWISVQTTTADVREVIAELARLRSEHGRTDVPFDVNVLLMDVIPGADGLDGFRSMADEIEALGMRAVFQVVPWYFSGQDPNDLGVRRDSLLRFGDEVIAHR